MNSLGLSCLPGDLGAVLNMALDTQSPFNLAGIKNTREERWWYPLRVCTRSIRRYCGRTRSSWNHSTLPPLGPYSRLNLKTNDTKPKNVDLGSNSSCGILDIYYLTPRRKIRPVWSHYGTIRSCLVRLSRSLRIAKDISAGRRMTRIPPA